MNYRKIRSYVLREGRVTKAQKQALDELWQEYGLEVAFFVEEKNPSCLFLKGDEEILRTPELNLLWQQISAPILEIGFGMGEALIAQALANPQQNYIGVEVHKPGVGKLLKHAREHQLQNLKVFREDVNEVLDKALPPQFLTGVNIFFPDPWPKKRHHKRRLIQPALIEKLIPKLKTDAFLHIATDWADYAEHIVNVMHLFPEFQLSNGGSRKRPQTRFELRGKKLGHNIFDFVYLYKKRV